MWFSNHQPKVGRIVVFEITAALLKKYVTHTSRRTVTDSDLSVKAGFQFIWEFYSIIQQALDSQLDRLKATSVCFNHQLKVTHFCLCTNSDKPACDSTAAHRQLGNKDKGLVLLIWLVRPQTQLLNYLASILHSFILSSLNYTNAISFYMN